MCLDAAHISVQGGMNFSVFRYKIDGDFISQMPECDFVGVPGSLTKNESSF